MFDPMLPTHQVASQQLLRSVPVTWGPPAARRWLWEPRSLRAGGEIHGTGGQGMLQQELQVGLLEGPLLRNDPVWFIYCLLTLL